MTIAETRVASPATQTGATSRAAGKQLEALTGLRFFAAFMVVMFHCLMNGRIYTTPPSLVHPSTLLKNFSATGYVGVSFFFILSGFILAYNYLGREDQPRVDKRKFWVARFARIYPAYIVALAVAFVPFRAWELPKRGLLAVPTLMQAWLPGLQYAWNGPSWSLSVEVFFYILFPFMAVPLVRLGRRRLLVFALGLWLAMLAIVVAYVMLLPDGPNLKGSPTYSQQPWMLAIYTNPLIRLPEFLIGVAVGRVFVLRGGRERPISATRTRAVSVCALAVVAAIFVIFCLGPRTPMIWANVIFDPLFAALIYLIALDRGPLGWFCSLSLVALLGEASYSLYLLHVPLWTILTKTPAAHAPLYPTFAAFAVGVILVSVIVLKLVENPARVRIRAALAPRRAR